MTVPPVGSTNGPASVSSPNANTGTDPKHGAESADTAADSASSGALGAAATTHDKLKLDIKAPAQVTSSCNTGIVSSAIMAGAAGTMATVSFWADGCQNVYDGIPGTNESILFCNPNSSSYTPEERKLVFGGFAGIFLVACLLNSSLSILQCLLSRVTPADSREAVQHQAPCSDLFTLLLPVLSEVLKFLTIPIRTCIEIPCLTNTLSQMRFADPKGSPESHRELFEILSLLFSITYLLATFTQMSFESEEIQMAAVLLLFGSGYLMAFTRLRSVEADNHRQKIHARIHTISISAIIPKAYRLDTLEAVLKTEFLKHNYNAEARFSTHDNTKLYQHLFGLDLSGRFNWPKVLAHTAHGNLPMNNSAATGFFLTAASMAVIHPTAAVLVLALGTMTMEMGINNQMLPGVGPRSENRGDCVRLGIFHLLSVIGSLRTAGVALQWPALTLICEAISNFSTLVFLVLANVKTYKQLRERPRVYVSSGAEERRSLVEV